MRRYTYNPSGGAILGPYSPGSIVERIDAPGLFFTASDRPEPQWGYYDAIEDDTACTPAGYYDRVVSRAFEGTAFDASGRVRETVECVRIPLVELEIIKRSEIRSQDDRVRYNAADSSLAANWWLVVTQSQRFELDGIQGNWSQRQHDSLAFPSGPNAPYVGIYNASTGQARRYQVNEAQWTTLYLEKTTHDQATSAASDASSASLDTKVADAEAALTNASGNENDPAYEAAWDAVAAHDAEDPAWGYPPIVELGDVARALFGP